MGHLLCLSSHIDRKSGRKGGNFAAKTLSFDVSRNAALGEQAERRKTYFALLHARANWKAFTKVAKIMRALFKFSMCETAIRKDHIAVKARKRETLL